MIIKDLLSMEENWNMSVAAFISKHWVKKWRSCCLWLWHTFDLSHVESLGSIIKISECRSTIFFQCHAGD